MTNEFFMVLGRKTDSFNLLNEKKKGYELNLARECGIYYVDMISTTSNIPSSHYETQNLHDAIRCYYSLHPSPYVKKYSYDEEKITYLVSEIQGNIDRLLSGEIARLCEDYYRDKMLMKWIIDQNNYYPYGLPYMRRKYFVK